MRHFFDTMKTEQLYNLFKESNGITTDSRSVRKGQIFFALWGNNYNGNKLWCPIFVIDDRYSTELQKRIIYAMNLDYLPYRYKIVFFDKLFKMFSKEIERNKVNNDNGNTVNEEVPMKVNFESVYKALKSNGNFNYCITAFDYTKIVITLFCNCKNTVVFLHIESLQNKK